MSQKYNQAKRKFAIKNDTGELVELGQFLRDAFKGILSIKREWFVLFDENGKYMRTQETLPYGVKPKYRTPDLIIFKKTERTNSSVIMEKPLFCLEDDGSIHHVHVEDTLNRNEDYKNAEIDLVIVDKPNIKVSIFDEAFSKCETLIKQKLGN